MIPLRILCVLLGLSIAWAQDGESTFEELGAGVRGPRIVEHMSQSTCQYEKNWPICADDDWGTKCPSGCRMQGLIDEMDQDYSRRIDKIKRLLADNQNNYKKSNQIIVETVNVLKPNLDSANQVDETYGLVSGELRRRIVTLKQRVVTQVNRIKALQSSIQEQVVEMKRLEVDIDIKIRACKGTCARSFDYQVDKESYDNIQKQLAQANSINLNPELQTTTLSTLKMRPLKDSNVPDHFKHKPLPEMQALNIINDIKQMQVVLERPETERNPSRGDSPYHMSESRGDGPPYSSKLVIPTHGRETLSLADKTSSAVRRCTKTTTKKIVSGPDGPREEVVEKTISSDGSDCSYLHGAGNVGGEGSTYHFSGADGMHKLDRLRPELESFFAPDSPSTASKHITGTSSASHSGTYGAKDKFADLGEVEEDDFAGLLPSGFPSGSASHSKTVVTSSFNKGGSTFETKSIKTRGITEQLGGVEHDQSAEDTPDFQARSFRSPEVKRRTANTGKDCDDIRQKHTSGAKSGIFKIKPAGSNKVLSVYCDQETTLGGWLLIQQRMDGSVNFNRTWQDYKRGFGSVDGRGQGEFWLGNENMHLLTQNDTLLRVELEDWDGNAVYAEYIVQVGSEAEGYALTVSSYEGTAGDALIAGWLEEGTEYTSHAQMKFSTFDLDQDHWEENCAEMYGGGWWYNSCQAANLNGIYYLGGHYDPRYNVPYEIENGIVWLPFKASDYSLKTVRMKIRPIETL
ncbi:fibrinogen alpha chain isoform X2 [Neopelma chrysocephalum]|uniref:fibrinogen alpha chain isoform X2 n=1 Tax=Neopelma chrysocephalum TaxID=114329 RepID=UPI000FCD4393|nr:fibrinogen alpha chain isoform X2 [Neopelma chrysocephalum]